MNRDILFLHYNIIRIKHKIFCEFIFRLFHLNIFMNDQNQVKQNIDFV